MLIGAREDSIHGGTTLTEKMTILRERGYDFLELSLTQSQIAALDAAGLAAVQRATEEADLPILSTSLGHFGGFGALDEARQDQIVADIQDMLTLTLEIGADTILLATMEESADVVLYAPIYSAKLRGVADRAAELGIRLALEHVGWYSPATLLELVQALDHEAFGIYFDMGNCLYVGENPLEQAELCAPYTVQLHIKGGPTTPIGAMPLREVRELLEHGGFHGRGCLEIPSGANDRPLAEARGLLKMAGYIR